ncbi:MAG: response regulator [Thermodesulfobacteriota bacterium]
MELLIADDEPQLRRLLSQYFQQEGWDVTCAENGQEALELIKSRSFDVVLSDVRMPGATGLDVLRAVRSTCPHSQVVLMTGYRSLRSAIEAVNEGAFAYIEKPFFLGDLRARVMEAFQAKERSHAEEHRRQVLEVLVEEREEEISLLRERSKAILSRIPASMVLLDSRGMIKDVNEAFLLSFSAKKSSVLDQPLCVGLSCPLAQEGPCSNPCDLWERFQEAASRGESSQRFTFSPAFGRSHPTERPTFQIMIICLPSSDRSQPKERELVLFLEDVTRERTMQMQILHSSRLASLGEMASGIVHEISQPLNAISSQAQLLRFRLEQRGDLPLESVREALKDITEQVFRISDILQHLRLYGKRSASTGHADLGLREVVEGSLKLISAQLKAWGIELHVEEDTGLPPIRGNLHDLCHVLTNILINARDAIRERASLAQGSSPPPKEIRIRLGSFNRNGVPWASIQVEDTGTGMEPWVLERAFDPTFSTKFGGEGTGMGLPIAASIVHAHGGDITVQSSPGQGTKVVIELPAVTD